MEGNRKRPSLNDEYESPCSKYRRLDIFEEPQNEQAISELNWAASSSTSFILVAINDIYSSNGNGNEDIEEERERGEVDGLGDSFKTSSDYHDMEEAYHDSPSLLFGHRA